MATQLSEDALMASICRGSFYDFLKTFWSVMVPEAPVYNWHIPLLCAEAQDLCERVFRGEPKQHDVVVNIAPGTTKSTILSVALPAWVWTRMPSFRTICGSYSYPLAMDLSRKSRDVVNSDLYKRLFPDVELRLDQNTKGYFSNTKGGMRYSVGIGGSVMGMHAHLIIVDDPLDPTQAISELELKTCNHWMREVLPSRKVNKAVTPTLLVMQRLHQDDPTALFVSRAKRKPVRLVCLPARLTEDVSPPELRKFYQDGLFDPVRMPAAVLKEAEEDLGQYGFAGQFLQNPVPPGGGMFKTDRIKRMNPTGITWVRRCRFWDKGGTSGGGAYTAGVLMGVDTIGRYWLLDVQRFQKDSAEREMEIRKVASQDGYGVVIGLEQEGGSGGKESVETSVRGLAGHKVRVQKVGKAEGGKVDRADPFSVQVNYGNVCMVPGHWNEAYVDELKHFPTSTYMDQVDASAGAFNQLFRKKRICGPAGSGRLAGRT